jgi:hypothetical protein
MFILWDLSKTLFLFLFEPTDQLLCFRLELGYQFSYSLLRESIRTKGQNHGRTTYFSSQYCTCFRDFSTFVIWYATQLNLSSTVIVMPFYTLNLARQVFALFNIYTVNNQSSFISYCPCICLTVCPSARQISNY